MEKCPKCGSDVVVDRFPDKWFVKKCKNQDCNYWECKYELGCNT